jgi:hypothetical protein
VILRSPVAATTGGDQAAVDALRSVGESSTKATITPEVSWIPVPVTARGPDRQAVGGVGVVAAQGDKPGRAGRPVGAGSNLVHVDAVVAARPATSETYATAERGGPRNLLENYIAALIRSGRSAGLDQVSSVALTTSTATTATPARRAPQCPT